MEGVSKEAFVQRLGNSPSHQQVGKNGSFWLPPEAKSEGFSTKLRDADSKLGDKNDTKAAEKQGSDSCTGQDQAFGPRESGNRLASKVGSELKFWENNSSPKQV